MDLSRINTPCYLLDEAALERNLMLVADLERRAGCKVLLALKAFATFSLFPLMRRYLSGAAASSLNEARLAYEEFGGEVHLCAPAYAERDFDLMLGYCDHVVFNSVAQWRRFAPRVQALGEDKRCAVRVNPEHSEVATEIYDPCARGSRLGITRDELEGLALEGISGIHFHTLCGHDAAALERTLEVVEERFGHLLPAMQWINLGGGHHLTRADYDLERLVALVTGLAERYGIDVYLEPGEGLVMDAGVLVASVLDVLPNGSVVLDASASAHAPDVLEMPFRPDVTGAGAPGELAHTYRLGGPTCMAGDFFGSYSFAAPLSVGDRVVFEDMAPYTMVKASMFNGVTAPDIAIREAAGGGIRVVRRFDYGDFKSRLS